MAFGFQVGVKALADALLTKTMKVALATSTWVPNRDDDAVDIGTASDLQSGELSTTGYTGGFAGAGRKTLDTKVVVIDDATDRVRFSSANPVWTALGPGSGGPTVAAACVLEEITNDAASLPYFYNDLTTPIQVNGGDFTLVCPANGWAYFQC